MDPSGPLSGPYARINTIDQGNQPRIPPTYYRSDLWWEDGNIIIEAETTRFRVYKGHLATHSEFFNELFLVPQPPIPDEGEIVDGCPVVRVSDSAEDWEYILRALLERRYVTRLIEPMPFDAVAAFLRLGLKYRIDVLNKEAIARLTYEFPTSLEDFDDNVRFRMISDDNDILVKAINLARECLCINSILPVAFYRLITEHEVHTDLLATDSPQSPEDHIIAMAGWYRAVHAQDTLTMRWLLHHDEPPQKSLYQWCPAGTCQSNRTSVIRSNFLPMPTLYGLSSWKYWPPALGQCGSCLAVAEELHNTGRKQFWQKLPSFFKFPAWEELLRDET